MEASGFSKDQKKEMESMMQTMLTVEDKTESNQADPAKVNEDKQQGVDDFEETPSSFLDVASSDLRGENDNFDIDADKKVDKKNRVQADAKIKERVRAAIVKKKKRGHNKKLGSRNRIKNSDKRKLRQTIKESRS